MKIFYSIEKIKINKPVLTVGTFDGVHLGHRKLLNYLVKTAKKIGGESVVFSFYPHPRQVIFPDSAELKHLNSPKEKIKFLEDVGIDNLIIYPFTNEFANYDSCYFIEKILHEKLGVKHLVVGHDHHFGKDRQGNVDIIKKCAKPFGFEVEKVEAYTVNKVKISSTKIRNLLMAGNIKMANTYLGYEYPICGKVIHGDKIGREIGFPTANIYVKDINKLIPKGGIYAVEIILNEKKYPGMLYMGKKPTFKNSLKSNIEVNIFDFEEIVYDSNITVLFKDFIREEKRFDSAEKLQEQLKKDKQYIESILK